MTTTTTPAEATGRSIPAIGGTVDIPPHNSWSLYLGRIRRRAWWVLGVGVISAAVVYTLGALQPTTYTVYATLSTATANRAPEQDGVLASGYVDYFNSAGYQNKLKAGEAIPQDVMLHARTAAASPIIYVEVTSTSRGTAEEVAPRAATAFSDEINTHLRAAQDATIAEVRKPFDDVRQANGIVSEASLEQLQDKINQITGDRTNKLTSLQMESAVSVNAPNAWPGALLALLGGLLFGCLLALAAGALSRRVPDAAELAAKAELVPLVELPAPRSARDRRLSDYRLQQLVNTVALADLPARATLVVTSTASTHTAPLVARAIAEGRAGQGASVMLVNADLHAPDGAGFADLVSDDTLDVNSVVVPTSDANLVEVRSGRALADPFAVVTAARAGATFERLRERADLVVVLSPPITEAAEAQVLCAVADAVLLVIDAKVSRADDATDAMGTLRMFKSSLLGSVLTNVSRTRAFPSPRCTALDASGRDARRTDPGPELTGVTGVSR